MHKVLFTFFALVTSSDAFDYEKAIDISCRLLHHEGAAHAIQKDGPPVTPSQKSYEESLALRDEWRMLWNSATEKQRKHCFNMFYSLYQMQHVAFLVEEKKNIPATGDVLNIDRYVDAWHFEKNVHKELPDPKFSFQKESSKGLNKTITLSEISKSEKAEIVKNITNKTEIEFLTGKKTNSEIPGTGIHWGSTTYGIKDEGKVIGMLGISRSPSGVRVTPVYILPHYRGGARAYASIACYIEMARRLGLREIDGIVDILNMPSFLLFMSLGFEVLDGENYGMEDAPYLFPGFRLRKKIS